MLKNEKKHLNRALIAIIICAVLLAPYHISSAEETKYYKSGIYTYEIVNEQEKQISICGIDSSESRVVIPSNLDGYQVYALGYKSNVNDGYEGGGEITGGINEKMNELTIPSSVRRIWPYAFYGCKELRKVSLPEGITLGYACFGNCKKWNDIVLPSGTICEDRALPDCINTMKISNSITADNGLYGVIQKMILADDGDTVFNLAACWVSVTVKQLIAPERAEKLMFNFGDGNHTVKKLYVNGGDTRIEANRTDGQISWGHTTFGEIYTVEGAKAISFAKKNKITYHIKHADRVKKLLKKKKGKTYQYQWKKARTTVLSYKYNKSAKCWEKSKKNVPTVYEIYGKKNKGGKYRVVAATKAKRIRTNYKFVKVKPIKSWNV